MHLMNRDEPRRPRAQVVRRALISLIPRLVYHCARHADLGAHDSARVSDAASSEPDTSDLYSAKYLQLAMEHLIGVLQVISRDEPCLWSCDVFDAS